MQDPKTVTVFNVAFRFVKLSDVLKTLAPEHQELVTEVVQNVFHPSEDGNFVHLIPVDTFLKAVVENISLRASMQDIRTTVETLDKIRANGPFEFALFVDLAS
jgi:hypothetical protein